ncbi:long-chain-alcohol oxidase FAO4A-like [Phoenix dactylifera]|uniref:Long-chain-alcohol oxidase n=1 Tax=Phoenix dactylifera TaxID=42345 RepID=A0A8B7CTB5_PHODC|nr:long-chain-alcohol oxidase FAO4A-like [Phoenix dactylifera]
MDSSHELNFVKSPVIAKKALLETSVDLEALNCYSESIGGEPHRRPPPGNGLTAREMDSLTAISDTFLPSIDLPGARNESIRAFYLASASMIGTPQIVGGYVSRRLRHALLGLLRLSLWLLSTWYGTFIFCGTRCVSCRFPFFHKFSDIDPTRREEILSSWSSSPIYLYRKLFRAMKFLIPFFYFTQVNDKYENPTWRALEYCGPDPAFADQVKASVDQCSEDDRFGPLHRALVHMGSPGAALSRAGLSLATRPFPGGRRKKPLRTILCDAVVVGSGSGGGVVAGFLARAGYKVVVLEKGGYHARSNLSLCEGPTLDLMYEGGGLLSTTDTGVVVLSGATVGGGSAINWAAALRTPDHVAAEWRRDHGLQLFGSDAYAEALDAVCERMGVQSDVHEMKESLNNAALRRGCLELGYPVSNISRNAPPDHHCGWCCFGCKDGRKKATSETWLVDMAESRNGVILPGCRAVRVLHRDRGRRRRKVATGVLFETESGETCIVESKVTVVACGALNTPVLLKRSGLRNPNIGKHLHLHPVVMVWGHFPESGSRRPDYKEEEKRSYEGDIMTAMSTVAANWGTTGYGVVIQTPALHPGMFSVVTPWTSGADFKDRMTRFARTAHVFALVRDRGSGTVDGEGNISYRMEKGDEESLKNGVEKMLRIMAAAGAEEVGTQHCKGERFEVKRASAREWDSFVKEASRRGVGSLTTPVCSAHQMGSCRMGVEASTSAVDEGGETWEVEGLFVADTSVFPTALGVNPMVTVQAIAYCTARSIVQVLRRKMMQENRNQSHGTFSGST